LIASAGGAAALTGLIFVAISINLAKILDSPGVSSRASEAVVILLGLLLVSIVALAPNQPRIALGSEFLAIGGALWLLVTTSQIRAALLGLPVSRLLFAIRVGLYQVAMISFLAAGLSVIIGWHGSMYWLVPACVFSLVAGVQSAWVLLVEILR